MTRAWRLTDADWNSWPDGLSDTETLDQVADLGLAGVELGVYDAAVELAPDRLAALAAGPVPVTALLLSLPAERWPDGALSGDVDRFLAVGREQADDAGPDAVAVLEQEEEDEQREE